MVFVRLASFGLFSLLQNLSKFSLFSLKGLQKVQEVGAKIAQKDKAMKDAIHARTSTLAKKKYVDEEYNKICEEAKVLQAQNQSLTEENQKLLTEIGKLKESEHESECGTLPIPA